MFYYTFAFYIIILCIMIVICVLEIGQRATELTSQDTVTPKTIIIIYRCLDDVHKSKSIVN